MDYDSAFADLNKALVDLDGDGKPDAVAPRAKLGANRLEPGEVPVQPEDTSSWWDRVKAAWASGGWQDPQPGQRGTFVPSRITDQGKAEPAVPGIIQQPAEGLAALMTAPLSDIVRSGDRDAIRAAAEASFDVSSMLPAAGVAATKAAPKRMPDRAMVAASNPDDLNTSAILAAMQGQDKPKGITAYHASPHEFDKFDMSKVGTGMGYLDEGHGLYFGTNKDWVDGYAKEIGPNAKRYEVNINADPSKFLNWDDIPRDMQEILKTKQGADAARQVGVPGIVVKGGKYGDSYVMFDDKPISINRTYANPDDPNTAAILAAMQGQERPRSLPQVEQTWGPKWDVLMGQQYRMAEAGGDLSTQYDILKAKLSKASGIDPEMRAAMEAKAQELAAEMGVEGRKAAGISANPDDPTTAAILALLTQQEKPSAGLVGKAKGARPEPDALIPKAEAMGADVAPQGKSSGSVAETAATDYTQFVRSLQDDPQSEPTVGMPTPGVDQSAVRAAYENGLRRWHSGFGKHATETPDPLGSLDGPLGKDLGAVMDSLRAAAKVAGRDLEVLPRSYGSQYGHLKTPTGDAWKVRVADHGNQSRHRAESDFNIAPGQMTVEEFLGLLPRIYANSSDPTTAAILALLTAQQQGGQPQQ